MRALELSLRNYRVFEEVDLELPARVIGIFGENGSGKSSLVESMSVALYGVSAARTKKQQIRTNGVLTDCEIRLVFQHGGQQYELRRALKGRGHAPEAELYAGDLLLASGVTEVDAEVQRLLHMDLQVFRASAYAEQKQLDTLSSMRPGERKEMALRLLGIRPVEVARAAARQESRAAATSAEQLAGAVADTAALEAEMKGAREEAGFAKTAAKAAAAELKGAVARAKAAAKAFDEVDAARQLVEKILVEVRAKAEERAGLEEQLEDARDRVEVLSRALADLPSLEAELAGLEGVDVQLRAAERLAEVAAKIAKAEQQLDSLPAGDTDRAMAELDAAQAALHGAQQAATEAATRRDHAEELLADVADRLERAAEADPSQPCPTCGQPLGDGFAGYLRHLKAEVATAKRSAAVAERQAREATTVRARADAVVTKSARAGQAIREQAERRARIQAQADELRSEATELAESFHGPPPDIKTLSASAVRAKELEKELARLAAERAHLATAEADVAKLNARIASLDQGLGALTERADALAFDPDEHDRLRGEHDDASAALEAERDSERRAADALADAEKLARELAGRLAEAREMDRKVGDLRSDARYLERTAMLLDGFRDHLVGRVGPELSREAEALFRDLTNHEYDDLRVNEETLAIEIADGDGYFPIERFSGSETDLANLALRVAISTHLSRVSGADLGMLVLDEVLGPLDAERKDLMILAMGRLSTRFHQLFVITHAEQVKDQFPASIEIRKVGRRRSVATLV